MAVPQVGSADRRTCVYFVVSYHACWTAHTWAIAGCLCDLGVYEVGAKLLEYSNLYDFDVDRHCFQVRNLPKRALGFLLLFAGILLKVGLLPANNI